MVKPKRFARSQQRNHPHPTQHRPGDALSAVVYVSPPDRVPVSFQLHARPARYETALLRARARDLDGRAGACGGTDVPVAQADQSPICGCMRVCCGRWKGESVSPVAELGAHSGFQCPSVAIY